MESAKRSFADAIQNRRMRMTRRMFWRGGRIHESEQDKDLAPDGKNRQHGDSGEPSKERHLKAFADGGEVERPVDTSGHPRTSDASNMRQNQYADGGEVADTSGVPQTDNSSQMRKEQYADGGVVEHPGYADGGEVQHPGYAKGGYVRPTIHEERITHFGAEPEDDHGGDVMKMVEMMKKRRARRY